MRKVAWDTSFRSAFKRYTRKNPQLQERILKVIEDLAEDPFAPPLKTHKLRGHLAGAWACWVEYDCRIVFAFEPDPAGGQDMIVLADIGTHELRYTDLPHPRISARLLPRPHRPWTLDYPPTAAPPPETHLTTNDARIKLKQLYPS